MRRSIWEVLRAVFHPIDDESAAELMKAFEDDRVASATLGFESRRADVLAQSGEDIRAGNLDRAVELLVEGKGR